MPKPVNRNEKLFTNQLKPQNNSYEQAFNAIYSLFYG